MQGLETTIRLAAIRRDELIQAADRQRTARLVGRLARRRHVESTTRTKGTASC